MPNTIRTLKRKAEEATNLILEGICCHLAFLFKVYFAELISIFFQNVNLTVPLRGFMNFFFLLCCKKIIYKVLFLGGGVIICELAHSTLTSSLALLDNIN